MVAAPVKQSALEIAQKLAKGQSPFAKPPEELNEEVKSEVANNKPRAKAEARKSNDKKQAEVVEIIPKTEKRKAKLSVVKNQLAMSSNPEFETDEAELYYLAHKIQSAQNSFNSGRAIEQRKASVEVYDNFSDIKINFDKATNANIAGYLATRFATVYFLNPTEENLKGVENGLNSIIYLEFHLSHDAGLLAIHESILPMEFCDVSDASRLTELVLTLNKKQAAYNRANPKDRRQFVAIPAMGQDVREKESGEKFFRAVIRLPLSDDAGTLPAQERIVTLPI